MGVSIIYNIVGLLVCASSFLFLFIRPRPCSNGGIDPWLLNGPKKETHSRHRQFLDDPQRLTLRSLPSPLPLPMPASLLFIVFLASFGIYCVGIIMPSTFSAPVPPTYYLFSTFRLFFHEAFLLFCFFAFLLFSAVFRGAGKVQRFVLCASSALYFYYRIHERVALLLCMTGAFGFIIYDPSQKRVKIMDNQVCTHSPLTCPLHTNSGCGKERRMLIGPW